MQDQKYFTRLSDTALEWAIGDIRLALMLLGSNPTCEAKYMDQLGAALAEQQRRAHGGCCPTCRRPL